MKIGIDARFWNETGVGRYIQNLVENIEKIDDGNRYLLFVRSQDLAKIQSVITSSRITCISIDIRWHSLREQIQLPKILHQYSVDLMHFPYFSVPVLYKGPFIITIHDLILHHFPTGEASTLFKPFYYAKWMGYKTVIAIAAKKTRHIITVSDATKEEIVNHLHVPQEKISVIYEGVGAGLRVKARTTKKREEKERYFIHVGNVYPHKDPKVLVDAFSKRNDQSISLYLVGKEDHFMQALKLYVQKNGYKNILFKGFVPDEELASLYQNALATIVTSKMEGFGLPVLEAMANKCLVISSDIPSVREVTHGEVLFFEVGNVKKLTELLDTIAMNGQNKYASQKDRAEKIAQEYSWEKMTKETILLYERCNSIRQNQ